MVISLSPSITQAPSHTDSLWLPVTLTHSGSLSRSLTRLPLSLTGAPSHRLPQNLSHSSSIPPSLNVP